MVGWIAVSLMSQNPVSVATLQTSTKAAEITIFPNPTEYPTGTEEATQTIESTPYPIETITPLPTIDSPLPTPQPTGELTLNDYEFSEPVTKLVKEHGVPILGWLPDNQRAIVIANELFEIQTLDVSTGFTVSYGSTGPTSAKVVWLTGYEKMAFLQTTPEGIFLNISSDAASQPIVPTTRRLNRDAIASNGNQVMVLEMGASMPRLFNGAGDEIPLAPIDLHLFGINPIDPYTLGPFMEWHPYDSKVAIWGKQGFVVYDTVSGNVTPYELHTDQGYWALSAKWSPNGQKIALAYAQHDPPFNIMWLKILDVSTGNLDDLPVSLSWISDIAWAPNSRQLLVGGHRLIQEQRLFELYLVDSYTKASRRIYSVSENFQAGFRDSDIAWSSDGSRLLYGCVPLGFASNYGVCESIVTMGGAK